MFNLHKPWPFFLIVGIDPSRKPGILLFKKDAFEFNCSVSFACGFIKELVPDFNRCDARSSIRSIEIQRDAVSTFDGGCGLASNYPSGSYHCPSCLHLVDLDG